jgi:hypothetical protein
MRIGNYEIRNPLKQLKGMMIDDFNAKSEGEKFWLVVFMNALLILLIVVMVFVSMSASEYMRYAENRLNEINEDLGRPYSMCSNFSLPKPLNCSCPQQGTS